MRQHRLWPLACGSGFLRWTVTAACSIFIGFTSPVLAVEVSGEDARILAAAEEAFNRGEHAEAVARLVPLHQKYPSNGEIPRLLTHAYHELGQLTRARETALDAISMGRLTADLLSRLAQIDQQRDDRLALTNIVGLLMVIDADNRRWRLVYGDLLADAARWEESAAVYRSLLEQQPQSIALLLRLGNVLSQMGDFQLAVTSFETAWHLGATQSQLPLTIAGLWQQLGSDRQALAWTGRSAALRGSEDSKLQLQLAQMSWMAGETQRAEKVAAALAQQTQANEIRAQASVLLGQIAMQAGRTADAVEHWRKAVDDGIESPQLLAAIGADCFNRGQFDKAAAILTRVVRSDNQSEDSIGETDSASVEKNLRFLVISLVRADQKADARPFLRQYIERFGMNDDARQLVQMWAY